MASSLAHFDDNGANKAPQGRSETIALTDTSKEVSVDRFGVSISSFEAMSSLLKYKKKCSRNTLGNAKKHKYKDSKGVINSVITPFRVIHCITSRIPGESKQVS